MPGRLPPERLAAFEGLNVTGSNRSLDSPLGEAASNGHAVVSRIFRATTQADTDIEGSYSMQLLDAARTCNEKVVWSLLTIPGLEFDTRDNLGHTPLMWSARRGNYIIFRMLRATGKVDLDARDAQGRSVLSWALNSDNFQIVCELLQSKQVDLATTTPEPLLCTAMAPRIWNKSVHMRVVKLLLDRAEARNVFGHGVRSQLLTQAVRRDDSHFVCLILDTPDINKQAMDDTGHTLLHIAAWNNSPESAEILLSRGICDINARDDEGWTALMYAVDSNCVDVCKLLLQKNDVDLSVTHPRSGETVLFHSLKYRLGSIWLALLESGRFDLNMRSRDGKTLLSLCLSSGLFSSFQWLLELGADPFVDDLSEDDT